MNIYHTIRTVIKAVRTGKIQLLDVKGRGEEFTDKELFQQYGHASRPLPESEGILLFLGGTDNAVVIATEDRRYRIALEEGEAAIYSDEGDKVHLKRNREIEVIGGEKVTVTTKVAEIEATTSAKVTSPQIEFIGNVTITGNVTATGGISSATSIADPTGTMADMRGTYNSHTHPENGEGGGTTNIPNQGM